MASTIAFFSLAIADYLPFSFLLVQLNSHDRAKSGSALLFCPFGCQKILPPFLSLLAEKLSNFQIYLFETDNDKQRSSKSMTAVNTATISVSPKTSSIRHGYLYPETSYHQHAEQCSCTLARLHCFLAFGPYWTYEDKAKNLSVRPL